MQQRRFILPVTFTVLVVALLVVLAIGVAGNGRNDALDNAVADHHYLPAPDATLPLHQLGTSATQTLARYRGHPVLVNVFASWCGPCQLEAPAMEQAERMLRAHGGTVIAVSYQDNAVDDERFVKRYGWTFPVVSDPSGTFASAFGVTGVPENFMIDPAGRVTDLFRGQVGAGWISHALAGALAQGSA
jgi:cytochrome c biogenesis protein CcmG/thiol:disulfide interchange protein DsbE